MIYARQPDGSPLIGYPIMQEQMTGIHLNADAIAIQDDNARFADGVRVG
jgi:hypothetical protein